MRNSLRALLCAVGYFTRIPIPAWVGYQAGDLDRAARYFPLVGMLVGLIAAVVFWLAHWLWPVRVAVLISTVATVYLTGAFHEDGLADSVDGLGGGYERSRVLEIMHDSRIGSFGAMALLLALAIKLESLAALPVLLIPLALIAVHAGSRLVAVSLLVTLDYVRPDGKAKPVATRLGGSGLLLALACGLAPLALLPWRYAALIVAVWVLLRWAVARYLLRRLGGYTGDTLGMTQQLAELAGYLVCAACVYTSFGI
ncbi:adenosylcobinamide-GDP ribazoletransferase [Amantichitinum ursilacus]|uniref:Adenosylcobinamide-GDP ribazoletransferase n=1 Tax=Amantichitinum ursilacus TaxID=857265 RepID=A0A0N0XGE4_9NEIS|nr:adenosylcobinamide-GDP ribazoletransferase [Amantichitinum ursilacus]KPC49699.1 Cobalamin synthase [Amantichitinum ursilacus]